MPINRYDRHCLDALASSGGVISNDTKLPVGELVVQVDTSGGDVTVTLPPVFESAGLVYIITLLQTTPSNVVNVFDAGDAAVPFEVVVNNSTIPLVIMSNTQQWLLLNLAAPVV